MSSHQSINPSAIGERLRNERTTEREDENRSLDAFMRKGVG